MDPPSRVARAIATLGAGRPILVGDEAKPGVAVLVAIAGRATPAALRLLENAGPPSRAEAIPGGVFARHEVAAAAGDLAVAVGDGPATLAAVALPGGLLASADAAADAAKALGVPFVTVEDVVVHRLSTEDVVEAVAEAGLPSRHVPGTAELRVRALRSRLDGSEHLALVREPPGGFGREPLVRLHSECLTGDALGSLRCDCGDQLRDALRQVAADPQGGAVLYLRGQEGRGIGLANKIRAYALQDRGLDTVDANVELGFPADLRDYGMAAAILRQLGMGRVRLLSNNPLKRAALVRYGIEVAERRPLRVGANHHNAAYLETKRVRLGHDLPGSGESKPPV